jgi:potassium efflux system protein
MPSITRLAAAALLVTSVLGIASAADTGDDIEGLMQSLSVDVVENRAAEVAASDGLDEAAKTELAETYRKVIANLETARSYRDATEGFRRAIDTGPAQIEQLRAELEDRTAAANAPPAPPAQASLSEVEQQLRQAKADLAGQETALADLTNTIDRQEGRPAAIRARIAEASRQIAESEDSSPDSAAATETELQQARHWASLARLWLRRAEVLMLEQELASLPIRLDLLRTQRELAQLDQRVAAQRVQALESAANELRLAEARRAKQDAEAAEREVRSEHPVVAALAARNTSLGEEIDAVARAIFDAEREERGATERARALEEAFTTTRQKIEVAGLSQILGQVLQEQRRALPGLASFARSARSREQRIAETTLSQILLEEEQAALRNIPDYVAQLTRRLSPAERAALAEPLTQLARARQPLVEKALATQRRYLQAMGDLDFAQNRLADVTQRFDAFLDKRLLWVRSTRPVSLDTMRLLPGQLADFVDPRAWDGVMVAAGRVLSGSAWFWLSLLLAVLLVLQRRGLRRVLRDSGGNVGVIMHDGLLDTLRGIAMVVLLALPWPLVMYVFGQEIEATADDGSFAKQFGFTLAWLAPLLFQLRALRHFVAPGSVAAVHFGWREAGLQRLHRDLAWFTPALVLTAALTILSALTLGNAWGSGLGRVFFLMVMTVFAVFFARLSHPVGGTLVTLFAENPDGRMVRYRHLWFVLMLAVPAGAAVVALAGFMYTAGTLIEHILDTAWFALYLLIVHQLVVRWLVINQRRLRLQALRARRQAELEARATRGAVDEGEGGTILDVEEPRVDFKALDATSRRLTGNVTLLVGLLGVWLIWRDMLPALRIFDDVTLWTYTRTGVEGEIPITLTTLGVVLLILIAMVISTRQLPAFLEITLLQRLNMTQGSRYTVLTLTRYTIVAVSIAWAFSLLGGSWSEIQWIFAALGVGIGFGLQEIVANFISGLIILFERPIRVGDVVTVGNTDGVVTRIQIRATTIRNWDRKELLVPNKNFITQELLNWSLSDSTTRILINVGIAYGSDVEKALRILDGVAVEHPRIMSDPAPLVVFEAFGDNALLLSLRCYIDDIDYRLRTITELNLAIDRQMAEAGIEIAFPQRDVHLDTRQPLDVRLHRAAPQGS